eukprot:PhF_6_TR22366/c0_g1_i1/m.31707
MLIEETPRLSSHDQRNTEDWMTHTSSAPLRTGVQATSIRYMNMALTLLAFDEDLLRMSEFITRMNRTNMGGLMIRLRRHVQEELVPFTIMKAANSSKKNL